MCHYAELKKVKSIGQNKFHPTRYGIRARGDYLWVFKIARMRLESTGLNRVATCPVFAGLSRFSAQMSRVSARPWSGCQIFGSDVSFWWKWQRHGHRVCKISLAVLDRGQVTHSSLKVIVYGVLSQLLSLNYVVIYLYLPAGESDCCHCSPFCVWLASCAYSDRLWEAEIWFWAD